MIPKVFTLDIRYNLFPPKSTSSRKTLSELSWSEFWDFEIGNYVYNSNDDKRQRCSITWCVENSNYNIPEGKGLDGTAFYISHKITIEGKNGKLNGIDKGDSDIFAKMAYLCYYASNIDPNRDPTKTLSSVSKSLDVFKYYGKKFFSSIGLEINMTQTIDEEGVKYGTTGEIKTAAEEYAKSLAGDKIEITNTPVFDGTNVTIEIAGGREGTYAFYATDANDTSKSIKISAIYNENGTKIETVPGEGKYKLVLGNTGNASSIRIYIKNTYDAYKAVILMGDGGGIQDLAAVKGTKDSVVDEDYVDIELGASVSIDKYVSKVNSTEITSREGKENSTKKNDPVGVEYGDTITYTIKVTNSGSSALSYDFKDEFDSEYLKYVASSGLGSNISATNGVISKKLNINANTTATITIQLKVIKMGTKILENKATIEKVYKYNTDSEIQNVSENITSSDYVKNKTYKASIDKNVVQINGKDVSGTKYAEPGDTVTFAITLKNTGTSTESNGNIKNISFKDTFTNSGYIKDIKYSASKAKDYSTSMPQNWSKNGETITYTNSLSAGKTATLYVQCTVKPAKSNVVVKNTVEITSVKNRNNEIIYSSTVDKMEEITTKDEDSFTIKKYTLNISKDVNAVYDVYGKSVANKEEVEIGDTIEYKITVANGGTDANKDGTVKEIYISDYFDNRLLQYVSVSGTGWSKSTETTNGNTTTIGFKYSNELALAKETTFKVKFKVLKLDKDTLASNTKITNTIEIKTDNPVKNKNNENIRDFLNGELKDDVTVSLLGYKLQVNKYISQINGSPINPVVANGKVGLSRSEMSNEQRYDMPVEVQKGDTVTYTIVVRNGDYNNSNTATIKEITILDTADLGFEFSNKDLKVYLVDKDGKYHDEGFTIEEAEGRIKTIKYSGEIKSCERVEIIGLKAKVIKTNLHLLNLKNTVIVTSAKGRNDVDIIAEDLATYDIHNNEDYVRLKDLTIAGTVWEDTNKDGLMDDTEQKLSGIKVNLQDVTNNKVISTETNSDGKYTFENVVKGTNKNEETGNYNENSKLIDYYVEFEYNGTQYISTEKYASDSNINSDGTYNANYEKDSNATEYKDVRAELNKKFETISNNKAEGNGQDVDLTYTKEGHESNVNITSGTMVKAQSFINPEATGTDGISEGDIKYLWLYEDGETEYLKYINLGLNSKTADISLKQDVYEVKTTINGEQTTYRYNQGEVEGSEYAGEYVTGGEESPKTYKFEIYNSDYYFRPSTYYTNQEVIRCKENTELDVEVTYKVTVRNENVGDGRGTYAVIKELVNYYSDDFIKYGTLSGNMKLIKIKAEDGTLEEINKEVINAYESGNKFTISDRNQYGEGKQVEGYNNLYITGLEGKKLHEGESFELYVTYTVGTYSNEAEAQEAIGHIILGEKNSIVEINAYSIYESDGTPAGYIDRDSNPGNVENGTAISEYEDDTYKTGIELVLDESLGSERKVKGTVWNDTRSEEKEGQYLGNGVNTLEDKVDKKKEEAESNPKLDETHDIPAEDIKVEMIEQVTIKQEDGTVRIYQEQVKPWNDSMMKTRTDENGKYVVSGFIPGEYITRFTYGDNGNVKEVIYNGQDYKSTTFNEELNVVSKEERVNKLEEEGLSDARDDEIRRLEVNSYAEVINNEKIENLNETTEGIMANAAMYAETVSYDVIIERPGKLILFEQFSGIMGNENRYSINNVDFGLEYRPEAKFELNKYISNIEVILSNGTKLFDIKYKNIYRNNNENETLIGTELDEENSVGIEKYQFLPKVGNVEGFGFLNTDVDLLQGSTIKITYIFAVDNLSEVDRISRDLYNLRYKRNLENAAYEAYFEEKHTASGTARNKLYEEYYGIDGNGNVYIKKEKNADYYGRYLGEMYYKGSVGANDVISEVKINKILDYVDTDLTFNSSENNGENNLWSQTTSKELHDGGYVNKDIFEDGYLVDNNGVRFDTENVSNLVISVDDRISDSSSGNRNISLSKFLKPQSISATESFGIIKLATSKVIASENDTNNMTFDNTAEVIEYTSQSGRVTNLEATIGNANVREEKDTDESDTGTTETISLIPPTGAYTLRYYIAKHMSKILIVLAVVVLIGIGIFVKKNIVIKKRYK